MICPNCEGSVAMVKVTSPKGEYLLCQVCGYREELKDRPGFEDTETGDSEAEKVTK